MTKVEWYQNLIWDAPSREAFARRLSRVRDANSRAQYVYLQALALFQTSDRPRIEAALGLIEPLVDEYDRSVDAARLLDLAAQCHLSLGQTELAIQAFRASIQREKQGRQVGTNSKFSLGLLAVRLQRTDLYNDVLDGLDSLAALAPLPTDIYYEEAIRAIISADLGDQDQAAVHARKALQAASQSRSGAKHHPRTGVVKITLPEIHERLEALAGGEANEPISN